MSSERASLIFAVKAHLCQWLTYFTDDCYPDLIKDCSYFLILSTLGASLFPCRELSLLTIMEQEKNGMCTKSCEQILTRLNWFISAM